MPDWLPFAVGAVLVIQFAGLGAWQVSRGLEKRAEQDLYADQTGYSSWSDGMTVRSYQPLRVSGRPDGDRQFLLDNIIFNGQIGYYVITPLETAADEPLLMINRGWMARDAEGVDAADIAIADAPLTIRGRAGSLPRAGYKMGDAILPDSPWPKLAVYPVLEDLELELGRDVQPFVLLMDPEDEAGFVRHWVPEEMGPGRHFGYALQWFAMGAVLAGLLVWNYRKRRFSHE